MLFTYIIGRGSCGLTISLTSLLFFDLFAIIKMPPFHFFMKSLVYFDIKDEPKQEQSSIK